MASTATKRKTKSTKATKVASKTTKSTTTAATKVDKPKKTTPKRKPLPELSTDMLKADPPTHDEIAQRAFEIWLRKGCPAGCDEQNWLEAEQELSA